MLHNSRFGSWGPWDHQRRGANAGPGAKSLKGVFFQSFLVLSVAILTETIQLSKKNDAKISLECKLSTREPSLAIVYEPGCRPTFPALH